MTCTELLEKGSIARWYFVSAKSGEFQVRFDVISEKDKDEELPIFSIAHIRDMEEKTSIIEEILQYTVNHNTEHVQFRNNTHIMLVTVDILETR